MLNAALVAAACLLLDAVLIKVSELVNVTVGTIVEIMDAVLIDAVDG